ncbi:MAG: zinc ribbon domain-containing protein [Stenomitos frigidus ULC029]
MPACPRCHQSVAPQAIACPSCRTPLKAHGHPGMPLYRATGSEPLCLTCTYHADDTCTFPKRPEAMDCTLYDDGSKPLTAMHTGYTGSDRLKTWVKRHGGLLALLGLLLLSCLLVLVR